MSLNIAIDDEHALSKELFVLGVGGVTAGATASGLSLITGAYVPQLMVLAFAAVMGLFANYVDRKVERGHFRLGFSVLGGIVWALLLPFDAVLAAAGGGAILGVSIYGVAAQAEKESGLHRVKIAGFYGLALMLAVFTTQTFVEIGFLSGLMDTIFPEFVMGVIWGAFMSAAAVASRVQVTRDMIMADYKATIAAVGLAERTLLVKGLEAYSQLMAEFARSEDHAFVEIARPVAEDVAKNMLVLARKTNTLRPMNVLNDFIQLEARIARIDEQLQRAEDSALRRELLAARAELEEQLTARRELRSTCARFETRQQRCITSLERLQIALIQNSSMGMEHVDLQDAMSSLQDLAEEIRWRGGWEIQDESSDLAAVSDVDVVVQSGVEEDVSLRDVAEEMQHSISSDQAG